MALSNQIPEVQINIEKGNAERFEYRFAGPFRIGRGEDCDVRLQDDVVSRVHAEVSIENNQWWVTDLNSGNGVWVDGVRVEKVPLTGNNRVMLGEGGPVLIVSIQFDDTLSKGMFASSKKPSKSGELSLAEYQQYYFGDSQADDIGQHTMMVRSAFAEVKKKQKRIYLTSISVILVLLILTGTYAVMKHLEVKKQKKLAEDIFYSMKTLELEFAKISEQASKTGDEKVKQKLAAYRAKQKELADNYDRFVRSLNTYGNEDDERGRLVLKVARLFGECEVNIPDGFRDEVYHYIDKWKSSRRFETSIARARENRYIPVISDAMKSQDLPEQFFYLGLQESNFDVYACGPKTRFGIAKGIWQFIPPTAEEYGLQVGPLSKLRIPDPNDDRHDFGKSTKAAARYLRHIYNTDAQASGLLVIASYNWGEGRINRLIRQMPKNPRDRNFWNMLKDKKHKIPKETYDYVFSVFSAAVIGENPRLFGFDFDNPLASR